VIQRLSEIMAARQPIVLSDGLIEVIKWIALLLMTADHYNKYIYNGTIPYVFEAGRLALPIFSIVFAYNLSRINIVTSGAYKRILTRLFAIALISSVPYIALGAVAFGWWPLNIIFTLLASGIAITIYESNSKFKIEIITTVVVLAGMVVEYMWPAITLTFCAYLFFKRPNIQLLGSWFISLFCLYFINGNFWAMLVIPIIILLPFIKLNFPRWQYAFYCYYPAHLIILWLLK
jgi:hypothetical protein